MQTIIFNGKVVKTAPKLAKTFVMYANGKAKWASNGIYAPAKIKKPDPAWVIMHVKARNLYLVDLTCAPENYIELLNI